MKPGSIWQDQSRSHRNPQDEGYRRLACVLLDAATLDYHKYYNSDLRRALVEESVRTSRRTVRLDRQKVAQSTANRLQGIADLAERWMREVKLPDKYHWRYPFWLAAEWINWEPALLSDVLLSGRTGDNIFLRWQKGNLPKDVEHREHDYDSDA